MEGDEQIAQFHHFDIALEQFNVNEEKRLKLYQLIAGIVYLKQIKFQETNGVVSVCDASRNAIQIGSDLLSINSAELIQALSIKRIGVGNKNVDEIR